jgi:drug/metabolite transporter (DMT)-like permease
MLAAAATGIQVGAAMVASRYVLDAIDPASLAMIRYSVGALCLLPAFLAVKRARIPLRDLGPIAVLGILQFGVLIAVMNWGLQLIPSGRAAVIFSSFPLLTMLFAALLGRETLGMNRTFGVLLTMAGVAVALLPKLLAEGFTAGDWRGEAAVLASAATGALCSVLYRPYLQRYPTVQVSTIAMAASVFFLAIFAAGEGFFTELPPLGNSGWVIAVLIGLSSGVTYFLWLWALGKASPTRVTIFLALGPVTATALGWALLDEPVGLLFLSGVALVVAGIWIAHRKPRQPVLPTT